MGVMDTYSRDGQRIPDDYWDKAKHGKDFKWETQQRVGRTNLKTGAGKFTVSTVWLPCDHGYGEGPPVIFETMVFGDKWDCELQRYSSEEDAMRGHLHVLDRLREAKPPFSYLDEEES